VEEAREQDRWHGVERAVQGWSVGRSGRGGAEEAGVRGRAARGWAGGR
jgi:hypothetical protein